MFRKHRPVREIRAYGHIGCVYHDLKQTLRIYGVPLVFRAWAAWEHFFPAMWQAMRANAETQAFEDAGDRVRLTALHAAVRLGKPGTVARLTLGPAEAFQIRSALDLYYYSNPKLLVFASAVHLFLEGKASGAFTRTMPATAEPEKIERGIPAAMLPMEMDDEDPSDQALAALFDDIKDTLSGAGSLPDDYRTFALWPDYLQAAWADLKRMMRRQEYDRETRALLDLGRQVAAALPFPIPFDRRALEDSGEDMNEIVAVTEHFTALLTRLTLNVSLLQLDWKELHFLEVSPFPAKLRQTRPVEVPL
jgi:hypothetical protein